MIINEDMTNKLRNYFHQTGFYKVERINKRQQRQIIQDVGCTDLQLIEFILYDIVTKSEEEE